jgi:DNA-binding response OmpR family regulator
MGGTWRELCLEGANEVDPQRRIAIVAELEKVARQNVYQCDFLSVDLWQAEVKVKDKPIHLTRLQFQLLRRLIERAGNPVSREDLLRSVWGYGSDAHTHTLEVHVHQLRQKLERDATRPRLIVRVPGLGYKFVPATRRRTSPG